jgi:hypothetical protein
LSRRTQGLRAAQRAVDAWIHPIGTPVRVRKDDGSFVETRTRSMAEMLGGHSAVIWLEGISGCYLLDRVKPIEEEQSEPEPEAAPVPIAHCPKCGAPWFHDQGFCGGCAP